MSSPSPAPDRALDAYLAAGDDGEVDRALAALLDGIAAPLVEKILRRQLGGRGSGFDAAELEDLHAATLLKLHLHLVSIRAGEREAPASFPDYVAVSAFNAAAGFLMAKQPERTRLRDRVRYVLRREERLAVWSGPDRDLLCGLERDRGRGEGEASARRLPELVARGASEHGRGWGQLPKLVATLLERLDAPCRFEELVDRLAERFGIHDLAATPVDGGGDPGEEGGGGFELTDRSPSAERGLDLRGRLSLLWQEIAELPANQRFALLFNLRGEGGEDLLDILLSAGIVTEAELARALGLSAVAFGELAPSLPRDDLWIADRLGLTRQQVINLRKSARLRLARRLKGILVGVG